MHHHRSPRPRGISRLAKVGRRQPRRRPHRDERGHVRLRPTRRPARGSGAGRSHVYRAADPDWRNTYRGLIDRATHGALVERGTHEHTHHRPSEVQLMDAQARMTKTR